MEENQSVGVVGWFKAHSTIIFIVIVGIVAGVAFLKRNPSSTPAPATTSGIDTTGLQTDANGNPIIYRDVGDTFVNVNKTTNFNGTQPVASQPASSGTVEHPVEPTAGGDTGTSGGSTTTIATIRQRTGTSGDSRGVPVRSGTNGNAAITGWLAYGSQTVVNGGPVQGGNNNPVSGGSGSTTWYPVSGGYLSAYDIASISSQSTVSQQNSQTQTVRNG